MDPNPDASSRSRLPSIRTHVKLVVIPVTVTDLLERPVSGLHKQDFQVFEDGVEQKISAFSSEESPVSVGLVFDASNSMRKKIDQSRAAMLEFLRMSFPGDEFFLLTFNTRPAPVGRFTTDIEEIQNALALTQSRGWTALFDAIYIGMAQMKQATHDRKVLLVVSDGGDNNSRYSESEIKNAIREADVRVFSISILDRSPCLERISEESGGRAYRVRKLDELPYIAQTLSEEIHSHYVLGYSPSQGQNDGKYHRVTVKLVLPPGSPRVRVAWRHGYYGLLR
ncbi:MAG: VWA domain-containing protein [Acidobacteriaceae bacterium]|nr:VWA domain-containing protein [Acidobacteriaceae bacterium]